MQALEDAVHIGDPNSFVRHPTRRDRHAGPELSKQVDAINFIVNKVMQQTAGQVTSNTLGLKQCGAK